MAFSVITPGFQRDGDVVIYLVIYINSERLNIFQVINKNGRQYYNSKTSLHW